MKAYMFGYNPDRQITKRPRKFHLWVHEQQDEFDTTA